MAKIYQLEPVFCEHTPNDMEEGKLYISKEFRVAIHLCACGCGRKTVTPIARPENWTLINNEGLITLRPSIGNFSGESPYHAHYYITNNKIEWL